MSHDAIAKQVTLTFVLQRQDYKNQNLIHEDLLRKLRV